jgi:predicted DNA-binding helix-hairpin-helix protein
VWFHKIKYVIGKAAELIKASSFDVCHSKCSFDPNRLIYRSSYNGKRMNLFKVLLSSDCKFDCSYCQNAWRRGETISPEDLAAIFKAMKERGMVSGAFISSAVNADPDRVMEKILDAGRLIRSFHRGYLHLKVIPGCSKDCIKEAIEIADRVSINLETTSESRMSEICGVKRFKEDIIRKQRFIAKLVKRKRVEGCRRSHSTQIIAGLGESDGEILDLMEKEYRIFKVSRFYISRFQPLKFTPLEGRAPESRKRIANLYKMDALLRIYGFKASVIEEIMNDGFLPSIDPKIAIAEKMMKEGNFNFSPKMMPGCGRKMAQLFREGRSLVEIKRMGYSIKRVSAYLKGQRRLYEFEFSSI